ncbi:MAG TPA: hypothetical protein VF006_15345 [Longimicrobium sp.]
MPTSLAGRSGAARLGSRLLLALALCACGGDTPGEDGGAGAARPADSTAASTAAAATDTCTGPPPAFAMSVLNGPWQGMLDSLNAHGVSFPDTAGNDTTATVKLCQHCDSVRVEIRSSNLTPCLKPTDLQGEGRRITGLFIVHDTFPAQRGWDTLYPGDTLFAFANAIAGPATLVYNQNGSGNPSPSTAWMFWYCQDGHSGGKTAQAKWRPRRPRAVPGNGKQQEEDDGGGTYGWMACASGCCQFYTPPPNAEMGQTTPPQANPSAPDSLGTKRPTWCNAR